MAEPVSLELVINSQRFKLGAADAIRASDALAGSTARVDRNISRVERRMRSAGAAAGGLSRALRRVFLGFAGFFVIKSAIVTIAKFEDTMVTVRGVTRATEVEFARLNRTARELGATTRFSAVEAGEGLLFLARAGFSVNQAIKALPDTLNLALTGVLDLGRAADIASNILSAFGLPAEETVRVVDALVIVSNRANTNVEQLAEAMKLAAPIAGALGHSVEETAAVIGVLGDSGIQASLAGTNLRGILGALLGPSGKAQRAIRNLKLELDEVSPAFNSVLDIFTKLRDAGFDAADAVDVFGRRNASASLVLINSIDKMEQLNEATKEFAGEAARLAEERAQTLVGRWRALISAGQELFLQIGEGGLKQGLKEVTDAITETLRASQGLGQIFGALAGTLLRGLAKIINLIPAALEKIDFQQVAAAMVEGGKAVVRTFIFLAGGLVEAIGVIANAIDRLMIKVEEAKAVIGTSKEAGAALLRGDFMRAATEIVLGHRLRSALSTADTSRYEQSIADRERRLQSLRDVLKGASLENETGGFELMQQALENVSRAASGATESVETLDSSYDKLYGKLTRERILTEAIFGAIGEYGRAKDDGFIRVGADPAEAAARSKWIRDLLEGNQPLPQGFRGFQAQVPDFILAQSAQLAEQERQAELAKEKQRRQAINSLLGNMSEQTGVNVTADEVRRNVITPLEEATAILEQLNLLRALGPEQGGISEEEYRRAVEQTNEALLEQSTTLSAGFERFFLKLNRDATDAATAVESVLGTAFRGLENAIADVVLQTRTWKEAMREVGAAIIRELVRISVRLLVNIALQSILNALTQGGDASKAISAASGFSGLQAYQNRRGAARGGIFEGPESGYPVILHGTEEVRRVDRASYQPLDGSVGATTPTTVVHFKQDIHVNALDTDTADKKILESIGRSGQQVAGVVVGEIQRDRSLNSATRAAVS